MRETRAELEQNKWIEQVIFACFGDEAYASYRQALNATAE